MDTKPLLQINSRLKTNPTPTAKLSSQIRTIHQKSKKDPQGLLLLEKTVKISTKLKIPTFNGKQSPIIKKAKINLNLPKSPLSQRNNQFGTSLSGKMTHSGNLTQNRLETFAANKSHVPKSSQPLLGQVTEEQKMLTPLSRMTKYPSKKPLLTQNQQTPRFLNKQRSLSQEQYENHDILKTQQKQRKNTQLMQIDEKIELEETTKKPNRGISNFVSQVISIPTKSQITLSRNESHIESGSRSLTRQEMWLDKNTLPPNYSNSKEEGIEHFKITEIEKSIDHQSSQLNQSAINKSHFSLTSKSKTNQQQTETATGFEDQNKNYLSTSNQKMQTDGFESNSNKSEENAEYLIRDKHAQKYSIFSDSMVREHQKQRKRDSHVQTLAEVEVNLSKKGNSKQSPRGLSYDACTRIMTELPLSDDNSNWQNYLNLNNKERQNQSYGLKSSLNLNSQRQDPKIASKVKGNLHTLQSSSRYLNQVISQKTPQNQSRQITNSVRSQYFTTVKHNSSKVAKPISGENQTNNDTYVGEKSSVISKYQRKQDSIQTKVSLLGSTSSYKLAQESISKVFNGKKVSQFGHKAQKESQYNSAVISKIFGTSNRSLVSRKKAKNDQSKVQQKSKRQQSQNSKSIHSKPTQNQKNLKKCDESTLNENSFSTIPMNIQSDHYSRQEQLHSAKSCFGQAGGGEIILSPQNQTESGNINDKHLFSNPLSPRDGKGTAAVQGIINPLLTKNHSSKFSFGMMAQSSRTTREPILNQRNSSDFSKQMSPGSSSQKNSLKSKAKTLLSNETKPSLFQKSSKNMVKDSLILKGENSSQEPNLKGFPEISLRITQMDESSELVQGQIDKVQIDRAKMLSKSSSKQDLQYSVPVTSKNSDETSSRNDSSVQEALAALYAKSSQIIDQNQRNRQTAPLKRVEEYISDKVQLLLPQQNTFLDLTRKATLENIGSISRRRSSNDSEGLGLKSALQIVSSNTAANLRAGTFAKPPTMPKNGDNEFLKLKRINSNMTNSSVNLLLDSGFGHGTELSLANQSDCNFTQIDEFLGEESMKLKKGSFRTALREMRPQKTLHKMFSPRPNLRLSIIESSQKTPLNVNDNQQKKKDLNFYPQVKTPSILESPVAKQQHMATPYETIDLIESSDVKTGRRRKHKIDTKVLDTPLRPFIPTNPIQKVRKSKKYENVQFVSHQKNLEQKLVVSQIQPEFYYINSLLNLGGIMTPQDEFQVMSSKNIPDSVNTLDKISTKFQKHTRKSQALNNHSAAQNKIQNNLTAQDLSVESQFQSQASVLLNEYQNDQEKCGEVRESSSLILSTINREKPQNSQNQLKRNLEQVTEESFFGTCPSGIGQISQVNLTNIKSDERIDEIKSEQRGPNKDKLTEEYHEKTVTLVKKQHLVETIQSLQYIKTQQRPSKEEIRSRFVTLDFTNNQYQPGKDSQLVDEKQKVLETDSFPMQSESFEHESHSSIVKHSRAISSNSLENLESLTSGSNGSRKRNKGQTGGVVKKSTDLQKQNVSQLGKGNSSNSYYQHGYKDSRSKAKLGQELTKQSGSRKLSQSRAQTKNKDNRLKEDGSKLLSVRSSKNQRITQRILLFDLDETLIHTDEQGSEKDLNSPTCLIQIPKAIQLERHKVKIKVDQNSQRGQQNIDKSQNMCKDLYENNESSSTNLASALQKDTNQTEIKQEFVEAIVYVRPHALDCLAACRKMGFQVAIFTASQQNYADTVIDQLLDPKRQIPRLYRHHCFKTPEGIYIKDLRVIRNCALKDIILVDNAMYSFGFQIAHGIPILPFYDDPLDTELPKLVNYLQTLVKQENMLKTNREAFHLEDLQTKNLSLLLRQADEDLNNFMEKLEMEQSKLKGDRQNVEQVDNPEDDGKETNQQKQTGNIQIAIDPV